MFKYFSFSFYLLIFSLLLSVLIFPTKINAQNLDNLIFVQIPNQSNLIGEESDKRFSPLDRYIEGARIVRFSLETQNVVYLTPEFYAAADPDISFDGHHIIFAGKRDKSDLWQIWEMKIDGSEKRQVTKSSSDCYMPVYAGKRFYLDDPQPTPQIIYAGTEHQWKHLADNRPILAIYATDPQGETTHRLSFNLFDDFSPAVLPDGRIVYSSWQLSGEKSGIAGKFGFMGINIDGTDVMTYYGNHADPVYKDMISISRTDDRVYFIESNHLKWLGGGNIAELSQARPLHSYKKLTNETNGVYHSPCQILTGELLSSFRSLVPEDVFSIYRINPESGERLEEVFRQPGWHSIDMHPIFRRSQAKGRSNWLIPGSTSGVFYCLDSYMTDLPDHKRIETGKIAFIRVLEGLPVIDDTVSHFLGNDSLEKTLKWYNPRKILGTAPVAKDGSFQIRVPAKTPINFQLLDADHLSLLNQEAWTWVMGNENRGCIGCHENRELSPPNVLVDAVVKPANDLTSLENMRTVDFKNQIASVIGKKCATADCHINGNSLLNFVQKPVKGDPTGSRKVYEILLTITEEKKKGLYIIPGNARLSPVIWHIMNMKENMKSRPERFQNSSSILAKKLTQNEKKLFIEWIDTGAFWDLSIFNN